ncbi:hypothetical protein [Amycolatopsis jiangsuensis]|uniref:Alkylhydroperoxidase family enzyme n=1 Tax=Amycolatopsis jiangsuensis TaxID=1181879 RepID=A0A840IYJ7_9PSEU|nr:hypothetical protein [Amycolatopsis jiangsuensis]MBB4686485.1 alkylhydroperoxidase family enzyme [Amycolatopsis jiangsuensis]
MGQDSVADGIKDDIKSYDDSLGQNALDAAKKAPVLGKAVSTIAGAKENIESAEDAGDIVAASGQLVQEGAAFVAGAAVDVASFALDPIGSLVSSGLNMLIELIQPLQDALHFVTGDGPSLKTASGNFVEIGKGFVTLADDFVKTGDEALKDWQGEGGEAAKKALAQFADGIRGIGSSAGAVAETLQMWSMVMTVIEEVVKAIISELVSWLIYLWLPALAASVVSVGTSVAAAMTASVAKVAGVVSKVTRHLGKLGQLLEKFATFLAKWTDDLIKQGSKLSRTGRMVTPGEERALTGAIANATKTKAKTFGDAALDTLKNAPGETLKQAFGVNPSDLGKGSAYAGRAGFDAADKMISNTRDLTGSEEASDDSGNHSAQETRENLDMGQ